MSPQKLSKKIVCEWIVKRKPVSHKGDYGHVLVIAGSRGMSGASVLSAWGALRGGAGLVTIAVPASQQSVVAKKVRPEAMTLALPETKQGTFSLKAVTPLLYFLRKRKITSIAIGPGLSRHPETMKFVRKFLLLLKKNLGSVQGIVLDADGFLALKPKNKNDSFLQKLLLPLVVTPHPGELANFLGVKTAQVQKERIQTAMQFAKLYSVACVLKGNQTVVTDGRELYLNPTGNPGMATGGSGDVLSGLIAALIPQMGRNKNPPQSPFTTGGEVLSSFRKGGKKGDYSSLLAPRFSLLRAACVGVYIHGLAGDLAKKEKTEISLLAGDIAEKIPEAFKIAVSGKR